MKKLFVSVPMNGRSDEDIADSILKMHKIAEALEGEELELIDSFINEQPKCNNIAIGYLGKSIELLADADIFIGIQNTYDWNGCYIEAEVAHRYGIKCYHIDAQYVIDKYNEFYNNRYSKGDAVSTCR